MKKDNSRILFWLVAVAVVAVGIYLVSKAGMTPPEVDTTPSEKVVAQITAEDWTKGTGELEIIEYSDFQCPACSAYSAIIKEVAGEFGNHVTIAYRHFPLNMHPNATPAAQSSEAAGIQGKFWEMSDYMFEHQGGWSQLDGLALEEVFTGYAEALELDTEKFIADYNSKGVKDAVAADYKSGQEANVQYTPYFIFNGERVENPRSLEGFRSLIRENLENETT